jgi:hypothetical protein
LQSLEQADLLVSPRQVESVLQRQLDYVAFYPSPDGKTVVLSVCTNINLPDCGGSRYIAPITLGEIVAITLRGPFPLIWSPDQSQIMGSCSEGYNVNLCILDRDGSNQKTLVKNAVPLSWSPNGELIYFKQQNQERLWHIQSDGSVKEALPTEYLNDLAQDDIGSIDDLAFSPNEETTIIAARYYAKPDCAWGKASEGQLVLYRADATLENGAVLTRTAITDVQYDACASQVSIDGWSPDGSTILVRWECASGRGPCGQGHYFTTWLAINVQTGALSWKRTDLGGYDPNWRTSLDSDLKDDPAREIDEVVCGWSSDSSLVTLMSTKEEIVNSTVRIPTYLNLYRMGQDAPAAQIQIKQRLVDCPIFIR